jgi:serine protease Do
MPNVAMNTRTRLLASAAALALVASVGGVVVSESLPARASAVVTSDLQTPSMPSFANVVERVKPAVVSVRVKIENAGTVADSDTEGQMDGGMDNLPPEIQKFFKRFGGGNGGMRPSTPRQMIGQGSGFFVSADGYVVTNNHVVENAKTVTITMNDGKAMDAKVIGTDPKTDLAVLKVSEKGDYPFVSLAKDAPRVGDWVVAIGNPFGLGGTVTAGIVSADGRDIGDGPYDSFMQIDAPMNKGNSGGPTFNLKGEVVGVNTAIFSPSGGSVGLGFAIPSKTVDTVVDSLEHGGVVSRGFLGVQIQPVSEDIADSLGLKAAKGALVDQTTAGTPAADAGLKAGDVIVKLNGQEIKDAADLTRRVGAMKPGDRAEIAYLREGKEQTANVTLASQKNEKTAKADPSEKDGAPVLGVQLAPAKEVSGAGDKGVAIVKVDPDSAAASMGLTEGDIILEVAGKPVSQPAEVKAGIASAKQDGKKAVLMKLQTADGSARFVAFAFPKA